MRLYQSGALLTGARDELIRRGALEKVIMGLYPGGAQIVAGTDAGIGNRPHDAYRRPAGTLTPAGPSPR